MSEKKDVMPAGSRPPQEEDATKNQPPEQTPEGAEQDKQEQKQEQDQDQPKHADAEALAKANKALEQKLGEQGRELGELRQLVQQLQVPAQEEVEEGPDYQAELTEVISGINEGELDIGEGMSKLATLLEQKNATETEARISQALQQREAEAQTTQFLQDEPEFRNLVSSGVLDAIKAERPGLHDNVSAYYAYKAQQAEKEAYERGKAEAAKLAQGAEQTKQVLQKPGQTARQTNPRQGPLKGQELTNNLLGALQRARGDGG